MASASKRKGSSFESDIAKYLNATYNSTEFCRTPGSGAFMGKSNSAKKSGIAKEAQITLRGDLITPIDFPYMIECKNYEDSPIYHTIIKGADAKLDKWLLEVEFDAKEAGIEPMLWFKTTRKGVFLAVKKHIIDTSNFAYFLNYRDYIIVGQEYVTQFSEVFWKRS